MLVLLYHEMTFDADGYSHVFKTFGAVEYTHIAHGANITQLRSLCGVDGKGG